MNEISLNDALKLLATIVKTSTSLDEFKHMDLSLVPAHKRAAFQQAFAVVYQAIESNELSKEDFSKKIQLSS